MRFTIITVCKDDLDRLKATRKSILQQGYDDFELIIIDGASTDGTPTWLETVVGDTAQWISEPDSGLYQAMNKGLAMASGEYLIFLNSGDTLAAPDTLEKVNQAISAAETSPAFIYGDAVDVTEEGRRLYRKAKSYRALWKCMFTQHQAMFFQRALVGDLRYEPQYRLTADYAFVSRFLARNGLKEGSLSVLKVDFPICIYSLGGINFQYRLSAIKEEYRIRKQILELPFITSTTLYIAHFVHFYLKVYLPSPMQWLRYRNSHDGCSTG